jgi:histidine triad (HIT) family protein
MASVFTKIIKGEIPCYKVHENDRFIAFLDISPLKKGHTLIVPKTEIDYIFDLDSETYNGLFEFAKEVAMAIKKEIVCIRVGITVIGLEVPHAHIHLIPINSESDMNFRNDKLMLSQEEFKDIASRINAHLITKS